MLLHLVAVPADQLGGLLHVAERLEPALADLVGHQRAEVVDAVLHDVGDVAQDADALLPPHAVPLELERLSGRHGVVDVLRRGLAEPADHDVGIDRRGLLVLLVAPAFLAVDDDRVVLAELGPGPLGGGVVGGLQFLVVGRHRGVRDPELLSHRRALPLSIHDTPTNPRRRRPPC